MTAWFLRLLLEQLIAAIGCHINSGASLFRHLKKGKIRLLHLLSSNNATSRSSYSLLLKVPYYVPVLAKPTEHWTDLNRPICRFMVATWLKSLIFCGMYKWCPRNQDEDGYRVCKYRLGYGKELDKKSKHTNSSLALLIKDGIWLVNFKQLSKTTLRCLRLPTSD